jgi:FlaA1/EpsC-like NDP-sugar epimerase
VTTVGEPVPATTSVDQHLAAASRSIDRLRREAVLSDGQANAFVRLAMRANRVRPAGVAMLMDAAIVLLSMPLASFLVAGTVPGARAWAAYLLLGLAATFCFLVSGSAFGIYGQVWRYASVPEARRLLATGAVATLLMAVFTLSTRTVVRAFSAEPWGPVPVPGVITACILATFLMGLVRYHTRLFARRRADVATDAIPVLIVGAGEVGAALARQLALGNGARVVGFVDDKPALLGRWVAGSRVVGTTHDIDSAVRRTGAHQVVVAVASPPRDLMGRVSDAAERGDVPVKVVNRMSELVRSSLRIDDLRNVRIDDLLGRRPVPADADAVRRLLHDKVVLITGAGGSIGSEISRQVAQAGPRELLLLDHDETHLHDVQQSLDVLDASGPGHTRCVLLDVRDAADLEDAFDRYRPQVVFHAAAHKHVPMLETHPAAAVRTNVQGTANLVELADRFGAESFIFISTDKAVAPSSVMGASKRVAESIVLTANQGSATRFAAVRFGNVLGSRGSVLPTFRRQIEEGRPVTVTHPEMTRYFMTIPEAVQLVIQAGTLSEGGDLFVLDMGEPVRIVDLARRMIRLSGRRADVDVPIVFSGIRPGEKLHEHLQDEGELTTPTRNAWISRVTPHLPAERLLADVVAELGDAARRHDDDRVRTLLFDLAHGRLEQPPAVIT